MTQFRSPTPEYIDSILATIATYPPDGPVQKAFTLASQIHDGQLRHTHEKYDYAIHLLRVFDVVRRFIPHDDEDTLAAALLHDGIEDLKKYEVRAQQKAIAESTNPSIDKHAGQVKVLEEAMAEARAMLGAEPVLANAVAIVEEVTNPAEFRNDKGELITLGEWQSHHAPTLSAAARLIKIVDQFDNVLAQTQEGSEWGYDVKRPYLDKADAVVEATLVNLPPLAPYTPIVRQTATMYRAMSAQTREAIEAEKLHPTNSDIPPFKFNIEQAVQQAKLQSLSSPLAR